MGFSRRSFIAGAMALLASPSIVRAESIMRVRPMIDWRYVPRLMEDPMPWLGPTASYGDRIMLVPSVWVQEPLPDGNSFNRWEPMKGRRAIPLANEVELTDAVRRGMRSRQPMRSQEIISAHVDPDLIAFASTPGGPPIGRPDYDDIARDRLAERKDSRPFTLMRR